MIIISFILPSGHLMIRDIVKMPLKYYAHHFLRLICSVRLLILYWKLKTSFIASKRSAVTVDCKKGEFLKEKGRYKSFLGKVGLKTSSKNAIISLGMKGWILSKHWLPSFKKKKSTAKVSAKTTESCQKSTRWQPTCFDEAGKWKQYVSGNMRKRNSSSMPLFPLGALLKGANICRATA